MPAGSAGSPPAEPVREPVREAPDETPRPEPEGLAVVDKPAGWTSHDVVARARRLLGTRRVGHAGTLDPMATGVLVLGVGRATRLLGHLLATDKEYLATLRLGVSTSTDDAEGEVLAARDPSAVRDDDLLAALAALTGPLQQVPPDVSALKVAGRPNYARVRAGELVPPVARPVTVHELELIARRGPQVDVRVRCSSGTYVRAIARDVGTALGVGAHLSALRRTRVGPFGDPVPLGDPLPVMPLGSAVSLLFPQRRVDAAGADDIRHGRSLPPSGVDGPVGVLGPDGSLLALVTDRGEQARPLVVFAPA